MKHKVSFLVSCEIVNLNFKRLVLLIKPLIDIDLNYLIKLIGRCQKKFM